MKTKMIAERVLLAGLLSAAMPSFTNAMPGDAHDDSTYPSYATDAVEVPGPIASPKALALDDAPYPDVATDEQQQAGIAIALTSGPEPYAHDDVTYAPPSVAPAPASHATSAVASSAMLFSLAAGPTLASNDAAGAGAATANLTGGTAALDQDAVDIRRLDERVLGLEQKVDQLNVAAPQPAPTATELKRTTQEEERQAEFQRQVWTMP